MNDFLYPTFPISFHGGQVDWELSPEELQAWIDGEKEAIREDKVWRLGRELFSEDGKPFEMSPAELAIFKLIYKRTCKRAQINSSTQYGKTLTTGRATLLRITTFPDEYLITVPDTKRGKILINYAIKAAAENDYFKNKLIGVKTEDRDAMNRLLEEKSKVKLTFQVFENDEVHYSSMEIVSTDARRRNDAINTIMGFGGRNVISDESSLVDDEIEAGIFRMLAGKGSDTFYLKIGNPFYRNHFYQSWLDPAYMKIFVDYRIGLADGRYDSDFIEEAKRKPKFKVLFAARFPETNEQDREGYSPLLSDTELDASYVEVADLVGELRLGCDVSGGGRNFSTIVLRGDNAGRLVYRQHTPDPLAFGAEIAAYAVKYAVKPEHVFIDAIGLGQAAYRRALEILGPKVNGVNVGEAPVADSKNPKEAEQYANLKAQACWLMSQWIINGGKLVKTPTFSELLDIKYKIARGEKKIQIISKEELRDRGIESPDVADALMLTFVPIHKPHVAVGTTRLDKI